MARKTTTTMMGKRRSSAYSSKLSKIFFMKTLPASLHVLP